MEKAITFSPQLPRGRSRSASCNPGLLPSYEKSLPVAHLKMEHPRDQTSPYHAEGATESGRRGAW